MLRLLGVVAVCGARSSEHPIYNYTGHAILSARFDHLEQFSVFQAITATAKMLTESGTVESAGPPHLEYIEKCSPRVRVNGPPLQGSGSECLLRVSPALLPKALEIFSKAEPQMAHYTLVDNLQQLIYRQREVSLGSPGFVSKWGVGMR
jgi:hypothetical protein